VASGQAFAGLSPSQSDTILNQYPQSTTYSPHTARKGSIVTTTRLRRAVLVLAASASVSILSAGAAQAAPARPIAVATSRPSTLQPGQNLSSGQALWSPNGKYEAIMQGDGNFVLYGPSGALWSSNTYGGHNNRVLVMQTDGNLVIYGPSGALWAANTTDIADVSLVVQNDSNLVLYAAGGIPLWDRHSGLVDAGAAIAWAKSYLGTSEDSGRCLTFVFQAWAAAGVNLRNYVTVPINGNTYPVDIWNHFNTGTTGNSSQPPAGALVFYANKQGNRTLSHVALSVGGGRTISTSDAVATNVHFETIAQHSSANYLGWWLP
jgi:cell wall-associated NlpC family hydrolase